jgi:NADH:ubiquinone oxidoreductase subunit 6 (subunit J)
MSFADLVFVFIVLVTMAGALGTVLAGSVVYAMGGLITTMFGIAGLYIYLNAPFLAMMQILVYVGAISILIAFAIMLAGPMYRRPKEWTTLIKFFLALIVSVFSFFVFFRIVVGVFVVPVAVPAFNVTTRDIGRTLFDKLTLPFELISLLIVVSIVGAVMLALFSKGEK